MKPILPPAPAPCGSCPYRRDVPAGVWASEEYEKLPPYDHETAYQPVGVFLCHQQDGRACAGWASVHGDVDSLALRVAGAAGALDEPTYDAILDYQSPVPVFGSGAEAAAHGLSGVEHPDAKAIATVQRLERKLGREARQLRRRGL